MQTAIDTLRARCRRELKGLRVGLLHGRLPPAEKAAVMAALPGGRDPAAGRTTVIEVGVDVPNASLMVIEHAERFGLAQLHQLRGRVGRGARDSVCILLYGEPLSETARARLKVIYENSDGFEIAQRDLELRGPGELLGERQSGAPLLRFADLERDAELVRGGARGRRRADRARPGRGARHVERWLGSRQELTPCLSYPMRRWTWRSLARRLDAYERLIRLDKPIGTLLLLWPTLWARVARLARPAARSTCC